VAQIVSIKKPIERLVLEIRSHVHDAGRSQTTCAKHQLQAGWRLLELRKRVEAGEAGDVHWWDWYETQFTGHIKSRKYAERLMKWAQADDPEAAVGAERERVRNAVRKYRGQLRNLPKSDAGDIVDHAMRLVDEMSAAERRRFDDAYRSKYK